MAMVTSSDSEKQGYSDNASGRPHSKFRTQHRQWKTAAEVPADSSTGQQLSLMRRLSLEQIQPEKFAKLWLDARRKSLNENERIGEHLSRCLNQVFYALDSYPMDPELREEGDVTDTELIEIVNQMLDRIDQGAE
ncbi:colicin immunity domain-containing protein [Streptomyces sp. NPDC001717]|uniref:colicin immunity domain-containing protein n=1 Tax=Streptomyces sp. NPDC001717 TaxID=3364604 RepID=UPI0036BBBC17